MVEKKIVLCPHCKGLGKVYMTNSDGSPVLQRGQPVLTLCEPCDGEGRLLMQATIEYFTLTPAVVEEEKQRKKWKFKKEKKQTQ